MPTWSDLLFTEALDFRDIISIECGVGSAGTGSPKLFFVINAALGRRGAEKREGGGGKGVAAEAGVTDDRAIGW